MYLRIAEYTFPNPTTPTLKFTISSNSKNGLPITQSYEGLTIEADSRFLNSNIQSQYYALYKAELAAAEARRNFVKQYFTQIRPELEQFITDFPTNFPEYFI